MSLKRGSQAFLGLFFSLLLISGVSAQDSQDGDMPEINPDDFLTVEDKDDIDVESVLYDFDNATRLVDYEFNTENGTRLLFYSDFPRNIEIYDINGLTDRGGETLPIKTYHLNSGYTEVLVDTTVKYGDRTVLMLLDDKYYVQSNDRLRELIGTPETTWGYILGIGAGGGAVFLLLLSWIRYKNKRVKENGVKRL
jgi:hypothetical protein